MSGQLVSEFSPATVPQSEVRTKVATFAEDERFWQDLAEVHLLLDFVSGRTDKSLDSLKDIDVSDAQGNPIKAASAQQIVEEICKISYPPGGSREANARQAALLLIVKDRLNRIASPARGLTIAFTAMFAGVSIPERSLYEALARLWQPRQARYDYTRTPGANSRQIFSSRNAYPYLEEKATKFWNWFIWRPVVAFVLIGFIVWVNWDVNVTSSMLQPLLNTRQDYAGLTSDKNFVPTSKTCNPIPAGREAVCTRAKILQETFQSSRNGLQNMIFSNLFYLHPVALGVRLFHPQAANTQPQDDPTAHTPLINTTLGVIGGLNSIIVPTMFGWLGTMASLLRSITAKVRERVLSPRDYGVSRVALFLGMLSGLAVGLFFNTGDASTAIGKGMSGTITLSAAGLSFLAGFGAEPFFNFIDSVLRRLFPTNPSQLDHPTPG